MKKTTPKVLVVATSRKTRGGITSVIKAHETGEQWNKYNCKWIETHKDGDNITKIWYFIKAITLYLIILPFYDIIHIHISGGLSLNRKLFFVILAKLYKKKIIMHYHRATENHLLSDKYKDKIESLFNYSDVLIVLSKQWINWINDAYPLNNFNFKILYNPCPNVNRDFSKKQNIILYAGILKDRKGYNRLLHAFSKIAVKYPNWKLYFAGNGEIEEAKQLAKELLIYNQTVFLGWITGYKKEQIFQQASIYCLPSWGEGFPMGVLDAIAYGIPIVTTPVGGIPDLIINGKNGFLINNNELDLFAEKLSILIESKEIRLSFVQNADKLLETELNINKINETLSKIYDELYFNK